MSKPSFKRIILFARQYRANQDINETLQRLVRYLKTLPVETYLDQETAVHFKLECPVLPINQMDPTQDLIVVVGGDGSLLSAARMAVHVNLPVIGINRGRLGFLTDISPQEMEMQLNKVLFGQYLEEKRSLLHMHLAQDTHIFESTALNDIVLSRGIETHLITFDVFINDQFVSHYRSDGLILATPTGSTAYALSAGGPIMHPHLNAFVMVPMFSHSFSSRPLVIDSNARIDLHIHESNTADLQLSCDGQKSCLIKPGQRVTLKQYNQPLRLLHPSDYHFYDTLRIKLGWGSQNQECT